MSAWGRVLEALGWHCEDLGLGFAPPWTSTTSSRGSLTSWVRGAMAVGLGMGIQPLFPAGL